MGKLLPQTKVKPASIKLLLWGVVVLILIDVLTKLSIIDLSGFNANVLTILSSLFVLVEIGIFSGKKLSGLSLFGVTVAGLAMLGVVSSILGFSITALTTIQGMVGIALGIFLVLEVFR